MLFRCFGVIILGVIYVKSDADLDDDWTISTVCTKDTTAHQEPSTDDSGLSIPVSQAEDFRTQTPGIENKKIDQTDSSNTKGKRKRIPSGRKGVIWDGGIIPYYFNTDYYGAEVKSLLDQAISEIEHLTFGCLRFQSLSNSVLNTEFKRNWLHFTNEDGQRSCSHFDVNNQENDYEIPTVLGYDCLKPHQVLHTLLHGVGLSDEITHPKRDIYVSVLWDNIQPRYQKLFRIANNDSYNMRVEYDPQSVMHFQDHAFTLNGRPTVVPIKPGIVIAPSEHLSQLDHVKLNEIGKSQCSPIIYGQVKKQCGYEDHDKLDNVVEAESEAASGQPKTETKTGDETEPTGGHEPNAGQKPDEGKDQDTNDAEYPEPKAKIEKVA